MAITYPDGTFIKAVVHGTQGSGSGLINVFNWAQYVSSGSGPEAPALLDAVASHLTTLWGKVDDSTPGTNKWDYVEVFAKRPTDTEFLLVGSRALNLNGLDVSDSLPAGTSPCLTGLTNYPKRRARKFLPTFGETYSAAQLWTASAISRMTAWALAWLTGFPVAEMNTYLYPIALHLVDWAWSALSGTRTLTIPAYQRRRRPGVGQ